MKTKTTLTKQSLRDSLFACLEVGYEAGKKGDDLQDTRIVAEKVIKSFVQAADNCPDEVLRIRKQ